MTIKTEVELKPFTVPNFVIQKTPPRARQDGFVKSPTFRLSELSDDVLNAMCDQFRDEVLAKAREGRK